MAITWRDIAAPDFRGAAAITAGANEAIQNSFKGLAGTFDKFGQQFVDKDTNAAIRAAMGLNSIGSLESDRANVLANAGRDADVIKLNQIMQQRADALQGTEKFNQETKANDQRYRIGEEALTDTGLNRARKIITDSQADELFGLNKQKINLDIVGQTESNRQSPLLFNSRMLTDTAQRNSTNSGTRLNNLNIGKLEQSIKDESRINSAIDRVSSAFIAGKKTNSNYSWQDAINYVDKDSSISGAEKVLVLDRANTLLGIDKQSKAEDADADRLIKKSTAKFQDKSIKDSVVDGIVNSVDTSSIFRPESYDKAFRDQLNSSVRMMINAGMPVAEAEANFIEIAKSRGNFGGDDYVSDAKALVDAFKLRKEASQLNKK